MSVLQASDLSSSQPLTHCYQTVHRNFPYLNFKEPEELKSVFLQILCSCARNSVTGESIRHFAWKGANFHSILVLFESCLLLHFVVVNCLFLTL